MYMCTHNDSCITAHTILYEGPAARKGPSCSNAHMVLANISKCCCIEVDFVSHLPVCAVWNNKDSVTFATMWTV